MHHKKIIALSSLLMLLGAGCVPAPKTPAVNKADSPMSETRTARAFTLQGLTFTLLKPDWQVASNDGQNADIVISESAPAAHLLLNMMQRNKEAWNQAREIAFKNGNRVSSVSCDAGHGTACYGLETPAGAYFITTFFAIAPPAEGSPPGPGFTEADIAAVLTTAVAK